MERWGWGGVWVWERAEKRGMGGDEREGGNGEMQKHSPINSGSG